MSKALVIFSGGQDSTYCLGVAVAQHGAENVIALTFNYGQTHDREIIAAGSVAEMYEVRHEVVVMEGVLLSTSPLIDPQKELEQYDSAEAMVAAVGDRVEATFVPMRNAFFLTLAANRAVAWGCAIMYTGVCASDSANYPDCQASFIRAQETTINEALGAGGITIRTPLLHMDKPLQCLVGLRVPGVYKAWAYSHTAYDGQYPPTGKDHATVLRAAGFESAGIPDPLVARAVFEGLMDRPDTLGYELLDRELDPTAPMNVDDLCSLLGAL